MAGSGHGTKAVVAALLANAGIAVAKFVGFLLTRSTSMLAESIHSVADSGNQGLLLFGGRQAKRDATAKHPFGFGRERYFWSFVVALILFSLGGMFAIYEGVDKLQHPHELKSPTIALGILGVGIVLEWFSFRTAYVEASRVKKPDQSWWGFVRHAKAPELPVVLLEDIGALVGLVVAFGAVVTAQVTDEPAFDAIGTLTIGTLLVVIAAFLAVEMKGLLIGEAASPDNRDAIVDAIEGDKDVLRLIHIRTQHMGPDELLVGAKVELGAELDTNGVAEAIDRIELAIRDAVPTADMIYLEPDLFHTEDAVQAT